MGRRRSTCWRGCAGPARDDAVSGVMYIARMPERFAISIIPEASDIDELGHVSNLVYLRWVLDVAMAHTRAVGWDFAQYRALGAVFMVRRHEIDYVGQVTLGQTLRAETWVDSW